MRVVTAMRFQAFDDGDRPGLDGEGAVVEVLAYRRRNRLVARLARDAPGVALTGVAAGQHVVLLPPPPGPPAADVHARAAGLGMRPGAMDHFTEHPERHPEAVVVGDGTPAEHAYPAALDALVAALRGGVRRRPPP